MEDSGSVLLGDDASNKMTQLSSDTSNDSGVGSVITEEMIAEEKLLEEKAVAEEKEMKIKMLKEKEKQELEEQCYKRLHLLLSRSSIYAKFMADKLKRDDVKEMKKKSRIEKQKNSMKRKNEMPAFPCKKQNTLTVVDAFRTESTIHNNEQNENNDACNSSIASNQTESAISKQPKLLSGGVMYPYQIEGFEWLKVLFENGVNGILADEMGLGKTIQCIAFIAYLLQMGVTGPFFICGPLSTLSNWFVEFKRFAPSIPVMVYHGDKSSRKLLREKIKKRVQTQDVFSFPVVITSYQIALIDAKLLTKIDWKLLVIDEAHRIKNFHCKLVTSLKCFKASNRLLMTGTPLQNNLAELWSLLNFILPEIFDDLRVFESWFDVSVLTEKGCTEDIVAKEQEKQIVSIIHQILTPFLLRRTKAEVQLKIPLKKEVIVHAPLTKLQEDYYSAVLNKTIQSLLGDDRGQYFKEEVVDVNSGRPKRKATSTIDLDALLVMYKDEEFEDSSVDKKNVLAEISSNSDTKSITELSTDEIFCDLKLNMRNVTMILRKICNHPYLISHPLNPAGDLKIDEDLIKSSGKLLVMDVLLPELKKRGHKVLLFSQFVTMLNILEDYCTYRNYQFSMLHGTMSLDERNEEIKAFNESKDSFLFLISTKAGGLGLNLAQADTVIIYDSDWNPQGDLQAQDRCHRIGQTKPVLVYRLIVPNTIDEKILNRAVSKRKLEKAIIKKGRFNSNNNSEGSKLNPQELLELLQSSDFSGFVKTDDNCVLTQDELQRILDRSDMVQV